MTGVSFSQESSRSLGWARATLASPCLVMTMRRAPGN
jgi:hypothetical protein